MSLSKPKLCSAPTKAAVTGSARLEAHIADGQAQLDGLLVVPKKLAQQQAVLQLRGVLVAMAPQVGCGRLQALHSIAGSSMLHFHAECDPVFVLIDPTQGQSHWLMHCA